MHGIVSSTAGGATMDAQGPQLWQRRPGIPRFVLNAHHWGMAEVSGFSELAAHLIWGPKLQLDTIIHNYV